MSKTRRLYKDFVPTHYELELDPDRDTLKLQGIVKITGQKVGRPSQRLVFHQNGLKVTTARIVKNDKKGTTEIAIARIVHQHTLNEVRLHTEHILYPGSYTVEMTFTGKVQSGMQGVYYSDYKVGAASKRLVSTQFESHFARMAFPCIDEPEAKATFALQLISPAGETAISNMPAYKQEEREGKLYTTFQTTPKMSSYLLAFVFGDMQKVEAKTKNGVDVRVWSTKAHSLNSLHFGLETAVRCIEFFEEYFGTRYPLPKCDHVAIPDFSSAAMENWGIITYREMALVADPKTVSQSSKELIAEVIAHEVSHQWFGNLVTMEWWDELWLNESFANVMAFVALDALFPKWEIWNYYIATDGLAAFRRDAIAGVQAIKTTVRHPSQISSIFDPSIVYAKGGRLINMLINHLGQEAFRKGLRLYFEKHAYGNTTGQNLWEALAKASGNDVSHLMEPWLAQSGFPAIEVTQTDTHLTLAQSHFLLNPKKADSRQWPVPLLSDTPTMPSLLVEGRINLELPTNSYAHINKGAVGHYVVQYVNPEHATYIAQLAEGQKLTPAERLVLLNDSSMLARAGRQSFSATLQLLEHYTNENDESVWSIMALILADLRRFVDIDPTLEEPIKSFVRKLIETQYQRLGWEEKPAESTQDTKLRALIIGMGVYANHPDIVAGALERFGLFKKDHSSINAELRGVIFSAAVREEAHDAFSYLLALDEQTTNTNLKQDIMDALTATKNEAQILLLLGRLRDSQKVRQHDVDRWVAYMLRNRYSRVQAWKWLQENWKWIAATFAQDHSYDYFPRYVASAFNTPQLLEEYKAFFEPFAGELALERAIVLGIEEVETRVAWLQRDIAAVKAYAFN